MTYSYKPIARKNFKTDETLYYPTQLAATVTDIDHLATEISEHCTLTRPDAIGVLKELEHQILRALLSGYTIRLCHLGSFRLTTKASCVDTADDVCAALVTKARVRYVPSIWIKDKLQLQYIQFRNTEKKKEND